MARSQVPPEIKAAAIADLLAGDQPAVVAERYKLDRSIVKTWKQRHVTDLVTNVTASVADLVTEPDPPRRPSLEAIQARLGQRVLELLEAKLTASKRLAEHVTRDEWLNKQSADAVADLGRWLDQTSIGILDRLLAAQQRPSALDEEDDATG